MILSFDIDGVIWNGEDIPGLIPGPNDIIITGRSFEEAEVTDAMLQSRGIYNKVFYHQVLFKKKTRELSGKHKANILKVYAAEIAFHYEDDPIQADIIRTECPETKVILLDNPWTAK